MIPSAPESISCLIFNEKSDVWSYGTLLLELYDVNLEAVPAKVLELSNNCHHIYPDIHPKFIHIESIINKLCDDDSNPVITFLTSIISKSFVCYDIVNDTFVGSLDIESSDDMNRNSERQIVMLIRITFNKINKYCLLLLQLTIK